MKHKLINKFIPSYMYHTVFEIDFQKIYDSGKKYILIDIDNTLIPYDKTEPDDKLYELFKNIKSIGFDFVLISNNHKPRVKHFSDKLNAKFVYSAKKPLKFGIKKALKLLGKPTPVETINLGDQIVTDVFAAHRIKIDSILVHPIKKKSEHWYTKINRILERIAIKRIKKIYPNIYLELMEKHEY